MWQVIGAGILLWLVVLLFIYVIIPITPYALAILGIIFSIACLGGVCAGIYIGVRNYWVSIQNNISNKVLKNTMLSVTAVSIVYFTLLVLFIIWLLHSINTSNALSNFLG